MPPNIFFFWFKTYNPFIWNYSQLFHHPCYLESPNLSVTDIYWAPMNLNLVLEHMLVNQTDITPTLVDLCVQQGKEIVLKGNTTQKQKKGIQEYITVRTPIVWGSGNTFSKISGDRSNISRWVIGLFSSTPLITYKHCISHRSGKWRRALVGFQVKGKPEASKIKDTGFGLSQ